MSALHNNNFCFGERNDQIQIWQYVDSHRYIGSSLGVNVVTKDAVTVLENYA